MTDTTPKRGRKPGPRKEKCSFYLSLPLYERMLTHLKMEDDLYKLLHNRSRKRYNILSSYLEALIETDIRRRELQAIADPAERVTRQETNALDDLPKEPL